MSQALLGLPALVLPAGLSGSDRRRFPQRLVIAGLLATCMTGAVAGLIA